MPAVRTLPAGLPGCACWLDAASGAHLFADAAGTVPPSPGQAVRVWKDRSGHGRHVSFGADAAVLSANRTDWIAGLPVVSTAGLGTFAQSPLTDVSAAGPYTVVAVWRVSAGGGHPLPTKLGAIFSPAAWTETVDTTSHRTMPAPCRAAAAAAAAAVAPSTFGIGSGEVVAAAWTRTSTGEVRIGVSSPADTVATAGRLWSASPLPENWTASAVPTVGAGVMVAEVMVWACGLSPQEWTTLNASYLQPRWGVTVPWATASAALQATLPDTVPVSLPSALPTPYCWLNATAQSSLFSDASGETPVVPGGGLRVWKDYSGNGRHATFAAGAATWPHALSVSGSPVVAVTGGGAFASSPLAAVTTTSGYTFVCVWRATAAGGHPFRVASRAAFTADEWVECVDTGTSRAMPSPASCGVLAGDAVVVLWHRSGDAVSFMLAGSRGAKYVWSGNTSATAGWLAAKAGYPCISAAGKDVHLGELAVWNGGLTGPGLAALSGYLTTKWGVGLPLDGTVIAAALPTEAPWEQPVLTWDASTMASMLTPSGATPQLGDAVSTWATTDGTVTLNSIWAVPLTLSQAPDGRLGVCGPLNSMMEASTILQCANRVISFAFTGNGTNPNGGMTMISQSPFNIWYGYSDWGSNTQYHNPLIRVALANGTFKELYTSRPLNAGTRYAMTFCVRNPSEGTPATDRRLRVGVADVGGDPTPLHGAQSRPVDAGPGRCSCASVLAHVDGRR
jgi:hypothetical protein